MTPTGLRKLKGYLHSHCRSCGVRGREVERWPRDREVSSLITGSGCQLWDCSLAHVFCASSQGPESKEIRKKIKNLCRNRCKIKID